MILAVTAHSERLADHVAVLIDDVLLFLVALEVGRGRIEEQQVDLEVQQVRCGEVHRLAQLVLDFQQPVHRAVAGVLIKLGQPGDPRALCHPLAARQLRQGLQRAVGDHREDHPLGAAVKPPAAQQPLERAVDRQLLPDPVKRPRAAHRPRLDEREPRRRRRGERLIRLERPLQRADQPDDRVAVELILAAEAVEHPHLALLGYGVPLVVCQLQVGDLAVLRPSHRPAQVHT